MENIIIESYKDSLNNVFFKKCADVIRKRRNEILQETDHILLVDCSLDETSLYDMMIYCQELRDFMNRLSNDEIECKIVLDLDEFVELHSPK